MLISNLVCLFGYFYGTTLSDTLNDCRPLNWQAGATKHFIMIPHVGRIQQKEIERCVGFLGGYQWTAASVLLCLMYSIGISWPQTETEEVPTAADCRPHK